MLSSIHLQNFRSHKDTEIALSQGVNVFIGLSDSGKTNIFRALDWVFNNRPSGDQLRSRWGGDTIVSVKLVEGFAVTRTRTKTENLYSITDESGHETVFKAFGKDVPREVKELLNLTSINVQSQFDAPFLLSSSSGEVARYLNQVANLESIDITMLNIGRVKKEASTNLDYAKSELEKLEEQVEEYANLDRIEDRVVKVEKLARYFKAAKQKYTSLTALITSTEDQESALSRLREVTRRKGKAEALYALSDQISALRDRRNRLDAQIDTMEGDALTYGRLKAIIEKRSKAETLFTFSDKIVAMKNRANKLSIQVDTIEEIAESLMSKRHDVLMYKKEFDSLMPDRCPLCEQEIKR